MFDVYDEAIIDAPPTAVYQAILEESAGMTHWWMPDLEGKLVVGTPLGKEGMVCDIKVQGAGSSRFTWKVTQLVENRSIDLEYSGDFIGTAKWGFEPVEGKTRISYRWNVRPKKLLFVLIAPFVNIGKIHSRTMQKGFKSLNEYLKK